MPGYETHLWLARKVGTAIGLLVAIVALLGGVLGSFNADIYAVIVASTILGFVGYYSTLVGGVAPDVDLSQSRDTLRYASIPYRKLVAGLRLLVAVLVLFAFVAVARNESIVTQTVAAVVAGGIGIVGIRLVPDVLHRFMPAHRRLTHDLAFWVITGIAGVIGIRWILQRMGVDPFVRTFLPIAVCVPIFLGVVIHVSLDTVSTYVKTHAPETFRQRATRLAPWVPKRKPILLDVPQLARIGVDRQTPRSIRLFVVLTFAYGFVPYDLIADFVPVIGWTDDLAIYLSLRETVYSGYRREEGVIETIRRELSTVIRVYIPVVLLSLLAIAISFFFLLG